MALKVTALAALPLLVALFSGCAGLGPNSDDNGKPKIVLAIQPTDNAEAIRSKAAELEAFLEARADVNIEIYVPMTYIGVVEALRFGHADVAMMSAWPSLLASEKSEADIVLAEKREVVIGTEVQIQPYYYSYYVVKKESSYQTLADVRDKRVAYPSSTSTSGYVYPLAKLVTDELITKPATSEAKADDFFDSVLFSGGYAQGWQALKNDQVDVTVIAGDVNQQLYFEVLDNTRIIATQGPVPSHAVVFARDLTDPVRTDLLNAFLELKGEHKALMRSLLSAIFVEFTPTTTDQHTAPLKSALSSVGLRFQEKLG